MLCGLRREVYLGYLIDQQFLCGIELLLFEVVAKGGSPYEALDNSIHVAGITDVIKTSKLVDLSLSAKLCGIKLLKRFAVAYLYALSEPTLILILHNNAALVLNLDNLTGCEHSANRNIYLITIVRKSLLQKALFLRVCFYLIVL